MYGPDFRPLFVLCVILMPLGLWKLVEIIIWLGTEVL